MIRRVTGAVGGILVLVSAVVLYSVWYNLTEGNPRLATIEGIWWAGYVDAPGDERTWVLARFTRGALRERFTMGLLGAEGGAWGFRVERSSSSSSFMHYDMRAVGASAEIHAKQLYPGKRYILQRLLVGRFSDFWKNNDDIRIMGNIDNKGVRGNFAIEPIREDRVEQFYQSYIKRSGPDRTLEELRQVLDIEP